MADVNGLKDRFNEIGTEMNWEYIPGLAVNGEFIINNIEYRNLEKLNEIVVSYIGDEYFPCGEKYYNGTFEYKFEYQTDEFAR